MTIGILMGGDVTVDCAHHLPRTRDFHAPRMLLHRQPPPGDWQTCDHDVAVALLLRTLLHPDIHELEVIPLRLEPEVDGVLLFGLVLIVEDSVGEPAIAFHAADALDLLK